ncbi:hypothetical protein ACFS07_35725 [Undibacterium arcticum]
MVANRVKVVELKAEPYWQKYAYLTKKIMNEYRRGGGTKARALWVKEFNGMTKKNAHLIYKINQGLIDPAVGEEKKVCPLDEDEITLA